MHVTSTLTCDKSVAFDSICQQIAPHDPTGMLGPVLEHLISPVVIFLLIFIGGRVLSSIVGKSRVIGVDLQVRTLVRNVLTIATWVFSVLGALVAIGVNISVLLTFGGLFSLAIGLAFQDVLRNLLAGMFLLVEKPFRLNDFISVGELSGTVQAIQLRTTALKTVDGRLIVLPNLQVFNGAIVNLSSFGQRRFSIDVRVPRTADSTELLRKAKSVLLASKSLAKKPAPTVLLHLEGEEMVLRCRYWLDYRAHDPDQVHLELSERLAAVGYAATS